jgi:hypothetical protein
MIEYNIEQIDGHIVVGWAHDVTEGAGPVKVRVGIKGGFKTAHATLFRDHLKEAGIAAGNAGFVIRLSKGEQLDPFADIFFDSGSNQCSYQLPEDLRNFLLREYSGQLFLNSSAPLLRCALVLIIKNEARYLREWLEYHRILGVDYFLVFDNGSEDDLESVLEPYLATGLAGLIHWPNIEAAPESARQKGWLEQATAYACAVRLLAGKAAWVGFLDVDEFFAFEDGARQDIKSFLDGLGSPIVSLFWRLFGTSGLEEQPAGLVLENFLRRGPDSAGALMKVFIRPESADSIINAHSVVVGAERLTGFSTEGRNAYAGKKVRASFRGACIHHYHTRSRSEYRQKVRRGWPKNTDDKNFNWEAHFAYHDRNEIEDRSLAHFAPDVLARIARMDRLVPAESRSAVRRNWIETCPSTTLFHVVLSDLGTEHAVLEGFLVDLSRPWERCELTFHDGYGNILQRLSCDLPCQLLELKNIGDGRYGFKASLPSSCDVVHFASTQLAGTVSLRELQGTPL